MKKNLFVAFLMFFGFMLTAQSQNIIGRWKTIDDETGKPKSIVEIFEKSGKVYGKIVELFDPASRTKTCDKCSGEDKNKPLIGLVIVKGMKKDGNDYSSGEITDPKSGKTYKCNMSFENNDKLKVRGYIGFSLLGRTQYWHREK